jgi:hypothetical protein
MSTEADDTGEDTADWEVLVHAVVNCRVCELVTATVGSVSAEHIQLTVSTEADDTGEDTADWEV